MFTDGAASALLRLSFWMPLGICTYLALMPSPPETVFRIGDVFLHGFAFSYLTFALGLAHTLARWWHKALWMLGYAVLIEIVQAFEPARAAEIKDVVVDCGGVAVGLGGFWLVGERVRSVILPVAQTMRPESR